MIKRRVVFTFLFLTIGFSAYAHRLNEYLQATIISLTKDSVTLQLHLTAGSDVAKSVLRIIDANGDGILSAAEQKGYAQLVISNLSLTIDGHDELLNLTGWNFPTKKEITDGMGDIQLMISARLVGERNWHRLVYSHRRQQESVVYLVNCLLPTDTGIRIVDQSRNADQSVYQLDLATVNARFGSYDDQQQLLDKADHWAVIKTYFVHGVRHILTGYDHLLFLCALVLGAAGLWDLVKIVTAFTIAHSITLTLATYGLAHLPEQVVEPFIAASIVFVAVQNVAWPKQSNGNSRLAVAFFFGLFHGLGFAGGLLELMHAMPFSLIVFAIVGFSLGVEAGNQLVLLPLYGALQLLKRKCVMNAKPQLFTHFQRYASGAVAIAGLYYLFIDLYAAFS